ncbi:hypothetical protein OF820_11710 [Oceanotoga sp. DSM 15011]|jgi:hypothetical protein|uniref:Transcriptional regulator HTH-type FeoC domain-containing protein n=1 Tax=Oceanotoga teriensis TaxID=515440 RepID=A0AA45C680_9BACT|nr:MULTISPECIES: hypothetical protein [Oceanotoga]MDN5343095.1 hypothetical protein [Oceanotoga sp.]PWJ91231.1 hypothetical protein C7380_11138 [Oceanotoga teriensis]UYO99706.1 hypothetical protein OF820_11710 [Oceanotoga sp. DSM 15011]
MINFSEIINFAKKNKSSTVEDIKKHFNLSTSDMNIIIPFLISRGLRFEVVNKINTDCSGCPVSGFCKKNPVLGGDGCDQ